MSRVTPFELVFAPLADDWFSRIRREADDTHRSAIDRAQFASLGTVQHLLAEIESTELLERDPSAAGEYLVQLYVAYRFWEAGQHVYPVPADAVTPPGDTHARSSLGRTVAVPHGACYLQLPHQLFWAQIEPRAAHEPLDGIFVTESTAVREVTAVAVLGLRPDRDGFSQIAVTVPHDHLTAALAGVRDHVFAPTMEGGERAGFRSLASTSELLYVTLLALTQAAAPASP